MKLLFSNGQIQTFQVQNDIFPQDLTLLKSSLVQFFESNPEYVVIDLSQSSLQVSDSELQSTLLEIKTHAQAKNINLVVAQSDIESSYAQHKVLEMALAKRAQVLENKLELREKMKRDASRMLEENNKLKQEIAEKKRDQAQISHKLNPVMEKLWSDPS